MFGDRAKRCTGSKNLGLYKRTSGKHHMENWQRDSNQNEELPESHVRQPYWRQKGKESKRDREKAQSYRND